MLDTPRPDPEEARDNASFAAILQALARPGTVRTLPLPGAKAVALALIDRECRIYSSDPALQDTLRATGATTVAPEHADHAFLALTSGADLAVFDRLNPGTALYPDTGATVITPAQIGSGARLRLTGPGIDGLAEIRLGGLHRQLWARRAHLCRYPLGVEMLLLDGDRLIALPRSTTVKEV